MSEKVACGSVKMAMGDIIGDCDLCNDLMAEIERLKRSVEAYSRHAAAMDIEIERLRAELGKTADQLQWANDERGRLEAEIDRQQTEIIILDASLSGACKTIQEKCAEIERLREALYEIGNHSSDHDCPIDTLLTIERIVRDVTNEPRHALKEKT